MNIAQYKYFVTVCDCGSYSQAADQLYTTQSTVSKKIIHLEEELNVTLFDRSHRQISLTPQGEIVYKYAKMLLHTQDELLQELNTYDSGRIGQIRIASIPVFSNYNLLDVVSDFQKKYPNIQVQIQEMEAIEIINILKERRCDFAFFRKEFTDHSLDMLPLLSDELTAVLPEDHPLADEKMISLSDLADDPFLLLDQSTLHYSREIQLCEQCGFHPTIAYTGKHIENILSMIRKDMGVALLMKKAAANYNTENLRMVSLKESPASTVCLLRMKRPKHNAASSIFWNYVKKRFSNSESPSQGIL